MAQQAAVKRKATLIKKAAVKKEPKTVPFKWEGKDRKGTKVAGETQGTNSALIKAQLRKQGVFVTKISKKSTLFSSKGKKIKPLDIAFLLVSWPR